MKIPPLKTTLLALAGAALIGCAAMESSSDENLMAAAGFRPQTPSSAKQQTVFAALPSYKVQRLNQGGQWVYLYKDPKQGVVYVGGPNEYERYRQLGLQQDISSEQLAAAELNQEAAAEYSAWGPWGLWY
jgi:hypothetical protein